MMQSFANQTKASVSRLFGGAFLVVMFMLLGSMDASAQERAATGVGSRIQLMADKLGVTPYAHSTWSEGDVAPAILQAMNAMQGSIADGSAGATTMVTYLYYSRVYGLITQYDVAVEVAIVTELFEANSTAKGTVPQNQLPAIYNSMINLF
ncbi:MAG: hypothetical protein IT270_16140 [Saprospiraceae bacterium]|nr:hypothetical protein [Saprospiraceae bacterium]MCC6413194.1 hypothetical protein [Saprospiraceae bacterium]